MNERLTINDIRLVQTCGACPEQYDAFIGDRQVGYLRLRHGFFRVDYPEHGGKVIYQAHPMGDGIFESEEREFYLEAAKQAILREYNLEQGGPQISNSQEFDDNLKKLGDLYEEGKDCLHKITIPGIPVEWHSRLFEILQEMRDLAAVQMQHKHWLGEN